MNHGKNTCNQLKAIRQQIADANGIEYCPHECTFDGECSGTCPACEGEMRYIESELRRRQRLGKKIAVVGLAMGLSATPALAQEPAATVQQQCTETLEGDVEIQEVVEVVEVEEDVEDEPFLGILVEQFPVFPGGELALRKYIADNIHYPDDPDCDCEDIEGVVYVDFFVDTLGSVSDVRVVRGLHPSLDAEAVRVVSTLPKFEPARQRGKAVGMRNTLPVKFSRDNNNSKKSKSNENKK